MKGNFHVQFLGEGVAATSPPYPTLGGRPPRSTRPGIRLDLDMDQVIFVPLCARCSEQIAALGRPTEPPDARDVVIVS